VKLSEHGSDQGASVIAPVALGAFLIGDEGTGELVGIVELEDLGIQVPTCGTGIKGIQDLVAAIGLVEVAQIAAIRIGNDSAITARQGTRQELADRGALAGARGAEDLEVFGLIALGNGLASHGEIAELGCGLRG